MKTASELKRNVEEELKWAPDVDETDIAVKVTDGVVALSGFVTSYPQKYLAETAVKRVAGVTAIANDIEVRLPSAFSLPDPQIAREAAAALKSDSTMAELGVQVVVHNGAVTLSGNVPWNFQRERAEHVVHGLKGVTSVINFISVRPHVRPIEVKQRIADAFRRNAQLDADRISIDSSGAEVTLRGRVRDWAERNAAEASAWAAPGVERVRNELTVGL